MSIIQRPVSPKLPTTLGDRTYVDLPGNDIWFFHVPMVYVIPTSLDVSKFDDALSRVLQLYPHAAGQFRSIDGRWFIELTNTAVPVDIEYKLETTPDSLLQDDWVVQDDLSPFVGQLPVGFDIINSSTPLLHFKLTFFGNETCIGISWHHSLGDTTTRHRFVHALSQFYQDLPLVFAVPTFDKYHFPVPTPSTVAEFSSYSPRRVKVGHFDESAQAEFFKNIGHVRWRFDTRDLEALRLALHSNGQNGTFLSKQDCLTAYLAVVLNHCRGNSVQTIRSLFNYRGVSAPFISENVANTSIVNILSKVRADMAGIAAAARDAATQYRNPDYVHGWVSVESNFVLEAANSRKRFLSIPDGELIVNSFAKFDFCTAHFGYPDGTRFYMYPWLCQLRVFKPNSTRGDDGVWRGRQSIEISWGVPADLKPKVVETLARGVGYMLEK